jgi:hypothetical protein
MKKNILFLISILLISCSESKEVFSDENNKYLNYNDYLSSISLPEKLTFCGENIPLNDPEIKERAEREFYITLQQPGQVILYLKRAGKYFPLFEKIINDEKMPQDLKYISVAESALYQARSKAGAIGIWQFMEETAKIMGLRVDDNIDERKNIEKSTIAAMKYLKQGYTKHKSWILTAAGYNMGNAGIAENLDYQLENDYFGLFLNEETSRYIFRIAIIKEIMENPKKYGFILQPDAIYKPDETTIVKIDSGIQDLSAWARSNGTSYKSVKLLNPWILKRALPAPKKGSIYEISLPKK